MFRYVLFMLFATCSICTGQSIDQPLSVLELDPPTISQPEISTVLLAETSTIQKDLNWNALGDDIGKVKSALVVLQQELKPGSHLNPYRAFEKAQNDLRRNIDVMAQLKADEFQKFRDDLPSILADGVRSDLTKRIKEIARDRTADLNTITLYKNLGNSIDLYVLLKACKDKDYYSFLNELENSLYDYASADRDTEYRETLGQNVARLKAIGEANHSASAIRFVNAIDALTRQPNVLLSVSESAINEFLKSSDFASINESGRPVQECILGTDIRGTANISAVPRIDLRSAFGCAAMNVILDGEARTVNVGYRKPVQINTVGLSPFVAHKQITFNANGLGWTPAIASANTCTTICSIDKVGGQLFSRLVKRIAWKKVSEQKAQAEAIGSEKLARRLEREFDQKLDVKLDKARQLINKRIRPLSKVLGGLDIRSTETELKIGATYSRLGQITVPLHLPAPINTIPSDVTIQIHQSILDQIQRRRLADAAKEKRVAVSIAILDRLVDETFTNDQDSSDSKLFELIFKSLRNSSNSDDEQEGSLSSKTFKRLRNLKFEPPKYDEKNEWFTIRGNMQK